MREILFRGKAVNRDNGYRRTEYKNGDWVYGLLTRPYDERFEELPAEMTNTLGISGIEVDHESVGQYIGLLDKNGTKIFEGDIVRDAETSDVGKIFFDTYTAMFVIGFETTIADFNASYSLEVIGNIYDNSELIGGETNG